MKKIIIGLLSVVLLHSCQDQFLDETPDNRVEINSLDKAAEVLVKAYPEGSRSFTDMMSDNATIISGYTINSFQKALYYWEPEVPGDVNQQDTPQYYWQNAYYAIAHANEVLAIIDQLPGDEAKREAIRGEALLCRAYAHFMLVNIFAKHYDSATAASDLGVTYMFKPETEISPSYSRNTVKEVYDWVEKDMLEGLSKVSDLYYKDSGKYHFNTRAANAFATRFYLYKGDYAKAEQYASAVLGSSPDSFIRDWDEIATAGSSYDAYSLAFLEPSDKSNLMLTRLESLLIYNKFEGRGYHFSTNLLVDSYILNLNDYSIFEDKRSLFFGSITTSMVVLPKFYDGFKVTNPSSGIGYPYTVTAEFRGEELVLSRAEARFQQGNITGAESDVKSLITKRYSADYQFDYWLDYYTNTKSLSHNDAIWAMIMQQRRVEFIDEGLRLFDVKRLKLPINHATVFGDLSSQTISLSANDSRKVVQVPSFAIVFGNEPNVYPKSGSKQSNKQPIKK